MNRTARQKTNTTVRHISACWCISSQHRSISFHFIWYCQLLALLLYPLHGCCKSKQATLSTYTNARVKTSNNFQSYWLNAYVYLYSNYGCVVLCCAVLCCAVLYSEWIGSDKAPKVLSCISKPRHRKHRFFSLSDWNSIRLASLQHTKRSQLFVCCAHDIHMQSILFTRTTTTKQLAINTDTHTNGSLSCTQFALYPIRSLAYAFPITPSFASISSVFVRQTHQTVWTERYCLCCILFCVLSAFLETNCAR